MVCQNRLIHPCFVQIKGANNMYLVHSKSTTRSQVHKGCAKQGSQTYLLSLALISVGFFLFSSANTTVNSRPRRTWPSAWYFASAASAGSTYWTKPKPRGSLQKGIRGKQGKPKHHQMTKQDAQMPNCNKNFTHGKPSQIQLVKMVPNSTTEGHDNKASTRLLTLFQF